MTEEQLQAKCTDWFWNNYHSERRMVFHVNNNSSNRNTGSLNKARGVVTGISDLVVILPNRIIFVELKVNGGVQSNEQRDFQTKVLARNHVYMILRSFEEWQLFVHTLFGKPKYEQVS